MTDDQPNSPPIAPPTVNATKEMPNQLRPDRSGPPSLGTPVGPPASHMPASANPISGYPASFPTAPPPPSDSLANPDQTIAQPAVTKGQSPWRTLLAFIAGGILVATGFSIGQLNNSPSPYSNANPRLEPPEIDASFEPAAYVAQILGPSVVQIETMDGIGSGVIYRNGYVITNAHVVDDRTNRNIIVELADGRTMEASLVGSHPNTDIAVLAVEASENLPVADLALGESLIVGQTAIAIGSPFDLQQSVTAGIISALNRPVYNSNQHILSMIQTDAPINPGNSGGALANKDGSVIGINTAIQTDGFSASNAGIGFAVPIDTAVRIADLLVEGKVIRSGFLGVSGKEPSIGETGVEIETVVQNSAAEAAGIEIGDRILTIDGSPVTSIEELAGLVLAHQANDEVILELERNGERFELTAILGEAAN